MSDDRAVAVAPTAAALVAAVAHRDAAQVDRILTAPGLDWMALAVVLADRVNHAPAGAWIAAILRDLRDGDLTNDQIAARYGLTSPQLRRLCADNHIRRSSPEALTGGRWMNHRGVQVWVADNEKEAG